jgi:hypothetical protein
MLNDISMYTDQEYCIKNIPNEFELFIITIRDMMKKCKYRKALEEIKSVESKFSDAPTCWRIYDLKIRCMNKIVTRKFSKYTGNKIKSLETWLKRIDFELDKWQISISFFLPITKETESDIFKQYELIILHILELIYHYALFCMNEKQIADCSAFLALGERVIKNTIERLSNPDCFNISQKILLFTSSLLIADNDFELSKIYVSNILKLCFRELFTRTDIEESINYVNMSDLQVHYIEKTFINISMGFYHLGVCEENLGNIDTAVEAYKQSRWFSASFIKNSIPEFTAFLADLEKRAISYHDVIRNLNNNGINSIQDDTKDKRKQLFNPRMNQKFDKTIKFIENIKFNEIDEGIICNKKEGVRKMLSTVTMLDFLSSEKFKHIVTALDKLEITKLEKGTKEKIQKKVNEINNDKIYKEKLISRQSRPQSPDMTNIRLTTASNYCKTTIDEESSQDTQVNIKYRLTTSSKCRYNPNHTISSINEVPKYKYSQYTFNRGYMKKINYLDSLSVREYNFQKKVLSLKKFEKLHVDNVESHKFKQECETKFNKLLKTKTKKIEEENNEKKKEILNEDKIRVDGKKERLEHQVMKSLSTKIYSSYEKFTKVIKPLPVLSKSRMNSMAKKVPDFRTFTQQNNEKIERLNQELNRLKTMETNLKKSMY